jgi:hypothetical protein
MKIIILLISLLIIGFLYKHNIEQVQTLSTSPDCKGKANDANCQSANNPVNAQLQLLCQQRGQVYDPKLNGCLPAAQPSPSKPPVTKPAFP